MISYYMWSTAGKEHHFWKSEKTFPARPAYVLLHQILAQIFIKVFRNFPFFFNILFSLSPFIFLNLKEVQSMSKGKQIR